MKRAIVTGGNGLIGRELCRSLHAQGWEVASFDLITDPNLAYGPQIQCDISDEASVTAAFAQLDWQRLDLVINNGGITSAIDLDLATTALDTWKAVIDSHLTGAFLVSRAAARLMNDGASILMITSTRAFMSEGADFAYAAAKGGLVSLTQALAVQLGPKIRVNAIAPGWISAKDTPLSAADHAQHPAGRVGLPHDIAQAVTYLIDAGFVTGQILTVDGGMTKKMIYQD